MVDWPTTGDVHRTKRAIEMVNHQASPGEIGKRDLQMESASTFLNINCIQLLKDAVSIITDKNPGATFRGSSGGRRAFSSSWGPTPGHPSSTGPQGAYCTALSDRQLKSWAKSLGFSLTSSSTWSLMFIFSFLGRMPNCLKSM